MTRSHRTFVSYIDKSREYYAAQGYDQPYRWISNATTPFSALDKPLAECRVALITTAALTTQRPLRPALAPSTPAPDSVHTEHLSWHKTATHTNDLGAFLPLDHLRALADEGVIGELAPRFASIPTVYSQRRTQTYAEEITSELALDAVDLAVLVPL